MRKSFMVEFTGTPEAGKTTTIHNVAHKLQDLGYQVGILQESAEHLPAEIPKGTFDANLWMHYRTQSGLLKAKYANVDVLLIDRGLIDSNFYGKKFLWERVCTEEDYKKFRQQFLEELFPDFVVALVVLPETSIRRRGGAGHLVNQDYIREYNRLFMKYYNEIACPKTLIRTDELNVYEMNEVIFNIISSKLP